MRYKGCCHSSVDSSAPSILLPRFQLPSTPSMLASNYFWIVMCRKDENKQKEAWIGRFFKKNCALFVPRLLLEKGWKIIEVEREREKDREGGREISFLKTWTLVIFFYHSCLKRIPNCGVVAIASARRLTTFFLSFSLSFLLSCFLGR